MAEMKQESKINIGIINYDGTIINTQCVLGSGDIWWHNSDAIGQFTIDSVEI